MKITIETIADWMREAGYRAQVETLDSQRPVIRSAASGYRFSVYGYGVDAEDEVTSIQFTFGIDLQPDLELVNLYNQEKRISRAYLDADGDLTIEWDIVVVGTGPEHLRECLAWWDVVLGNVAWFRENADRASSSRDDGETRH